MLSSSRKRRPRFQKREGRAGDHRPGKASDYISSIQKLFTSGEDRRVILYCRVSGREQKLNLKQYETRLKAFAKRFHIEVVDVFREVSSGWLLEPDCRSALVEAGQLAKRTGAGILAYSTDRFLRNQKWTSKNPAAWPTVSEFEQLRRLTKDVPLFTLIDPDDPWIDRDNPWNGVKARQTKLGKRAKKSPGGRPRRQGSGWKKKRREELQPRARRLISKGLSYRDVSRELGVPSTTIHRWLE